MTRLRLLIIFVVLVAAIVGGAFFLSKSGLFNKQGLQSAEKVQPGQGPPTRYNQINTFSGKISQITDTTFVLKNQDGVQTEFKYTKDSAVGKKLEEIKNNTDTQVAVEATYISKSKSWIPLRITVGQSSK